MHFSKHFLRVFLYIVTIEIVNGMLQEEIPTYIDIIPHHIYNHRLKPIATWAEDNITKVVQLTAIENAINKKIEELKLLLQDDDIITDSDKIRQDDTTVVELSSTDTQYLREKKGQTQHDDKYRRLKKKIDRALKKEFISDKTHDLIIKTLDNLIAKLGRIQRNWKDIKISTSTILTNLWNKVWKRLKNDYLEKIKLNDPEQAREMTSFFNGLYTFFSFIIKDIGILSNKYKIKCITDKPIYRQHEDFECDSDSNIHGKDCKRFFICSKELKNFMLDFYNFINDTTVSVIRNYAEMYLRDTDNFTEKHKIVSSINTTSVKIEEAIIATFIKETISFKLDINKNKESNIKSLSNYVRTTIAKVNNSANDCLNMELKDTKASLSSGIKADLNANLKIDLENLQREVLGRICFIFRFCNGKYRGRRNGSINQGNVVVNNIESEIREFFNLTNFKRIFDFKGDKKSFSKHYNYATINVTRTTPLGDYHSN